MIDDFVEQHKLLGNAVPRIINDYAAKLDSRRVTPQATPADLEQLFNEPLPETGIPIEEILRRFTDDIEPNAMGVPSPKYFGQFNPTPLPIGVWADALSSLLNQNAGAWRNGPTSAMIEARVIRWLCDLLDYGPQSFGTLASGGSEANLIALKCARDRVTATIKDAWCAIRRRRSRGLCFRAVSLLDRQERRLTRSGPREFAQDSHGRTVSHSPRRLAGTDRARSRLRDVCRVASLALRGRRQPA